MCTAPQPAVLRIDVFCCCLLQLSVLQKLVGPGTPRPAHPIQPAEVAEFVAGSAAHGLVLVAFGSTIQTVTLTRDDMLQLAEGFAALAPTRVLWAMSQQGFPDGVRLQDLRLGANTLMVPWVDYNVSPPAQRGSVPGVNASAAEAPSLLREAPASDGGACSLVCLPCCTHARLAKQISRPPHKRHATCWLC